MILQLNCFTIIINRCWMYEYDYRGMCVHALIVEVSQAPGSCVPPAGAWFYLHTLKL